jgi:uridine phosphorylase
MKKNYYHKKNIPILNNKYFNHTTIFTPDNLLREARRQNSKPEGNVPDICILDPDGDIVRQLMAEKMAEPNPFWACYHTQLLNYYHEGMEFGIIGYAVGAPFAVLVAEELFASGCRLVISVTSAGQILPKRKPPYFILIEKALRDEGTSYHYLPPAKYAGIQPNLIDILAGAFEQSTLPVEFGATWTTDAPFREVQRAIDYSMAEGILAVEMEAAALYAFAESRQKPVICFALVTNRMGKEEGDFEKGDARGSTDTLKLITVAGKRWRERSTEL